jgi:hypothetical protein
MRYLKKSFDAPMRSRRSLRIAAAIVLASTAFTGACSRNSKPEEAAEPAAPTYLKVENRAFLDMTMYVIRSSQRVRLGIATGNTTTRLLIPNTLLYSGSGTLSFQASPIGGRRAPISQEINVSAGDEVTLLIPPS